PPLLQPPTIPSKLRTEAPSSCFLPETEIPTLQRARDRFHQRRRSAHRSHNPFEPTTSYRRSSTGVLLATIRAVKKLNFRCQNFVDVLFAVGAFPRPSLELTFDCDLGTFAKIFRADLGALSPNDDVVPLGALLRLTVSADPLLSGGHGEAAHSAIG